MTDLRCPDCPRKLFFQYDEATPFHGTILIKCRDCRQTWRVSGVSGIPTVSPSSPEVMPRVPLPAQAA